MNTNMNMKELKTEFKEELKTLFSDEGTVIFQEVDKEKIEKNYFLQKIKIKDTYFSFCYTYSKNTVVVFFCAENLMYANEIK